MFRIQRHPSHAAAAAAAAAADNADADEDGIAALLPTNLADVQIDKMILASHSVPSAA